MRYVNFLLLFGLVFLVGIVSAHDVGYKEKYTYSDYRPHYDRVVTQTTWTYYDNDDRYSTYDYRHGYSYRATRDYNERKVRAERAKYDADYRYGYDWDYHDYHLRSGRHGSEPDFYYYDYVPHLRDYERRGCYTYPPADRLFYVAC